MTKNTSPERAFSYVAGWVRGIALLCTCAVLHCGTGDLASGADEPVEPSAPPQLALYPSNVQLAQGTGQQFTLRGLYADGRVSDLTAQGALRVVSASGHSAPVPPDGYLQLAEPGRYQVVATYKGSELVTAVTVTAATVKSVAISPRLPMVAKGLSKPFTATATFSDGTTQDVTKLATWAVKDVVGTGIATIDTTGVFLAKNEGKATITTRYMSHSSSTTVTVTAAALTTLFVSPADPTIASGTNQHFTATGSFSDGTTADLTSAATWAVSDLTGSGVAAIDGAGVANGKAVGVAQVSADYGGLTGQTTLTVSPAVPVAVAISPTNSSIAKGTSQRFAATATLTDGTTQDVTAMVTWTASDRTGSGVATIDGSGLAKGNAEGSATIACALMGHTASALLTVTPAVLTSITVTPATLTLYQGQYGTVAATGVYSDGSTHDLSASAIFAAADLMGTDVASVTAGGRVFAKNLGKATISATAGGYSASAVVTVIAPMYTGLSLSPTSTFTVRGLPVQFSALATLPDGSTRDVTASTTWTAADLLGTGVASIDSKGLANGLATGLAEIRGSFSGFKATAQLVVVF